MKFFKINIWLRACIITVAAGLHLTELNALASEGGGNWRGTYDVVMIWLNFGIFAFLLVKFLKDPLLNFLRGRKDELALEMNQLEEKREQARMARLAQIAGRPLASAISPVGAGGFGTIGYGIAPKGY